MSDEAQEQVEAVEEETPSAKPEVADEPKKSVKFESEELTFDEAQAEIDAIKARAGEARESLRSVPTSAPVSSSYSSSSAISASPLDEDVPKSKNMLSHLNSHSAMINYKVQAARSLVRKQEDLLRNLARMRENMERSENEIGKASDYYSHTRHQPRGYFEKRAESAPLISRRHQVCDVSPVVPTNSFETTEYKTCERAYSPVPTLTPLSSHVSAIPSTAVASSSIYQPDEEFEKEMEAIRKRVANLGKQANEVTSSKLTSYDYDSVLPSSYLRGGYNDIYSVPDIPKVEVKRSTSYKHQPRTHHLSSLPKTVYTTKHVAADNGTSSDYPRNSYTDYLMESMNELDNYPCSSSRADLNDIYADPLVTSGVVDCPLAY